MEPSHSTALGVLLAAGSGTRFFGSQHKLLAHIDGQTIFSRSLNAMAGSHLDGFIVVSGALDLDGQIGDIEEVHNPDWKTGQRSSVITAINFARNHGYDAIVVGLADQPFLTSEAWTNVASSMSPIAIATYNGTRGNPVRLHSSVWETFEDLESDPDAGARSLIHLHPELVREVACEGNSADIDTTEDLDTWT
ncbi:MAG: nucleotidyltransferase family protein [Ilumatobacteraceae bacterium]|jgi:molybdenum cofactor cytidylyltransferase|nr:nucleotidyltransferase family protein [Ilumatobacteraceae bacterium]MDP5068172.1 nucleotidyltransferase family protein [Ilumatobacteraceae bacterium]